VVHDVEDINLRVVTKVLKHQRWRGQTDQLKKIVLEGFYITVVLFQPEV